MSLRETKAIFDHNKAMSIAEIKMRIERYRTRRDIEPDEEVAMILKGLADHIEALETDR